MGPVRDRQKPEGAIGKGHRFFGGSPMGEGRRDEGDKFENDEVGDPGRCLQRGLDNLGWGHAHRAERVYRM